MKRLIKKANIEGYKDKFKFYMNDSQTYDDGTEDVNSAIVTFVLKRTNESKKDFNALEDELSQMSEATILDLIGKDAVIAKLNETAGMNINSNDISFQVSFETNEIQVVFDVNY